MNLCFESSSKQSEKKILNKEMFFLLKNYLFPRVSADKFQPPIVSPFIDQKWTVIQMLYQQPYFYVLRTFHLQRITTKNP